MARRFSSLSNRQLREIHSECEKFEQTRNDKNGSTIEVLLANASADIRDALCGELVSIELDWQIASGLMPDCSAYLTRFPDHANVIQEVFARFVNELAKENPAVSLETSISVNGVITAIPQCVGRYRIDALIGKGAFGIVYKAHDSSLNRSVAIKVPHAHCLQRAEDAKAYLDEAQTVAKLDHTNIVPVYDFGSTDEVPYFVVSKYIEGESLAKRLKLGRLSVRYAIELVASVAETLHYAHTQGVVHRDVK
ncbi:MAG: serine/threonine protein kinase, partial [Planctomycetales bacterium]|nr:serine/threonine protein kinase [Planctomycetales bacterium]